MKVRVTFTLEVDTEGWTLDYGVEGNAAIREDVREWVKNVLDQSSDNIRIS